MGLWAGLKSVTIVDSGLQSLDGLQYTEQLDSLDVSGNDLSGNELLSLLPSRNLSSQKLAGARISKRLSLQYQDASCVGESIHGIWMLLMYIAS